MTININGHGMATSLFDGTVVLSDTDESGTSAVKNIVVISQANYDALGTKDSSTLYFIT
jgi:hypothetical protein